jgi:hypothetical protein
MQHKQSGEPEEAKSGDSSSPHEGQTSEIPISTEVSTKTSSGHGTGPRTLEGKERSKHNATRHGIFSSVVVLKGEARWEYETLLDSLWKSFGPEGGLEELLVEKIAVISWRQRRLLEAEGAEVRRGIEFVGLDVLSPNSHDSPALDRLSRYEATLDRAFDRALNQLDRFQRIRLGQPVAPRIDVNLSA